MHCKQRRLTRAQEIPEDDWFCVKCTKLAEPPAIEPADDPAALSTPVVTEGLPESVATAAGDATAELPVDHAPVEVTVEGPTAVTGEGHAEPEQTDAATPRAKAGKGPTPSKGVKRKGGDEDGTGSAPSES